MSKNIMIPLSLLMRIVDLLDCLDPSSFAPDFCREYGDILWGLKVKMQKIELRDAYARIVSAKGGDDRDLARIEYLRQRSQLGNVDV